ncbi:DUF983 domain-containing protein [bacterium]|nr:DUF983 domain-containing protein [bacterium]
MKLLRRWWKALWRGATCRCPKCGQGALYETFLRVRKTCPACGVTFQPYAGDSLGVYAICYGLSVVPAIAAAILVGFYLNSNPYVVLATFAGVSGSILFGLFRNMKGLWIALVFLMTGLRKNL